SNLRAKCARMQVRTRHRSSLTSGRGPLYSTSTALTTPYGFRHGDGATGPPGGDPGGRYITTITTPIGDPTTAIIRCALLQGLSTLIPSTTRTDVRPSSCIAAIIRRS